MKDKKFNHIVIISAIISFIIGLSFMICLFNYYNIKFTSILYFIIVAVVLVLFICIPPKIAQDKEKLVNQIFIVDIASKDFEHIRITEDRLLFKYKNIIKYYYIFPDWLTHFSLKGKSNGTPTYEITGKIQLSDIEFNNIVKQINQLENINGDIIVNYKGNRKEVGREKINKIFEKYHIKI